MSSKVRLTASDGHSLDGYVAEPAQAARAGVVVVQEIFGVNGHMRSLCDRFAAEGLLAIAPALYDRARPGVELAYGPEGVAAGRTLRAGISDEMALRDIDAALHWLSDRIGPKAKLAVVGFCWGGTLAWLAATRSPGVAAAVSYYGTGIAGYAGEMPRAPVLLHFGGQDPNIPLTDVHKIRQAHPDIPVYVYDAGHGFNCDDRAAYEPVSAAAAAERTQAFLVEHLG
jgi:carboxymethylenebutenolidase